MMELPFSHAGFLEVFAAFNSRFLPLLIFLWAVTAFVFLRLHSGGSQLSRWVVLLLVVHWGWAGVAYHWLYFAQINPAAPLFGALFLLQAGLLAWYGLFKRQLVFVPAAHGWSAIGWLFILSGLAYPFITPVAGMEYPLLPVFGIPCPTTLITIGALLMVPREQVRPVAVIPIIWAVIGGSAVFLFRVWPDLMLFAAAILLAVYSLDVRRFARSIRSLGK
ncbi:DUF6064 family protein [Thiohalobacter thiocyanaticus]|nr:DUF6064 family protein [Thiohalobacter thiocyanaticus]